MNHSRVVLGLFVVAASILGTAGYDVVQSDRSVDVTTAGDQDAYLALERPAGPPVPVANGTTGDILYVTNQFASTVDITLEGFTGDTGVVSERGLNRTDNVDPGGTVALSAAVSCDTTGTTHQVQVDLLAESGDGSVSVDVNGETVEVECTS